ncbi:MAG TPA: response regulator transcription factor [Candidatus Acidoferrales bacterium]|nr:response regulator transcription factor [Candidatus Acidoferrales bacterium]
MAAQILVVDDNEVVRGRISETLKAHEGWEVCAEVENGEQALAKAKELNPDLIILDLAMPVMDGLRATREITRILPSVPIVIYTMHYAEWLELEAKKAGARGLVSKSDVTKLINVAEDLLRKKSPVDSAPAISASTEAHAAESRAVPEQLPPDSQNTRPLFKPD